MLTVDLDTPYEPGRAAIGQLSEQALYKEAGGGITPWHAEQYYWPLSSGLGRTYQYFTGKPTYPFGYGLSYTSFKYSNIAVAPRNVSADGTVRVDFNVTNTGPRAGATVAQLYIAPVSLTGKVTMIGPGAVSINVTVNGVTGSTPTVVQ